MVGELAPDAVEDGRHKLAPEAEVTAQLFREVLWVVILISKVPFKLVNLFKNLLVKIVLLALLTHQANVSNMNVELEDDPLVLLLTQEVLRLRGVTLHLLLDGRGDGRDEVQRIQIQVIAENLRKLFRCQHVLMLVPQKCIA